jgi:hypothetical protein
MMKRGSSHVKTSDGCYNVQLETLRYNAIGIITALNIEPYATFNNISVISWRSVVLVEETGVLGENHRHVASH